MAAVPDEAYDLLHRYGPEYAGDEAGNHGLTNHGPMALEVIVRRELDIDIDGWLDRYVKRLADRPPSTKPISSNWAGALGDGRRLPDWTSHFIAELSEQSWPEVLATWWPRLLPGVIAGATHGVIRVGHAVRTLGSSPTASRAATEDLAHGLAFWAARYRPLGDLVPAGMLTADQALLQVHALAERQGRIADRLTRLQRSPFWAGDIRALHPVTSDDGILPALDELIAAAVRLYLLRGHAAPVLLVHTATAPNAIRHVLPFLPRTTWAPSYAAAWLSAAAITATYSGPDDVRAGRRAALTDAEEAMAHAAAHGDEHVLKFTDTAIDAYQRTGDPELLHATRRAAELIAPPSPAVR